MLKETNKLTVLHEDNGTFVDHSFEALDYSRDTFATEIVAAEDFVYVGYEKPINAFYAEFATANTNANSITISFWNGSAWTAATGSLDETQGWTRSGFIRWDRNQVDEAQTTVNSVEQYWYRLSFSADHSATSISGLNIVFSDDQDLKREFAEVLDSRFIPSGESSHILTHAAARNEIVQRLRKTYRTKYNQEESVIKKIDAFDLLEIEEIRQASVYLVLSKIFFALSDEVDDSYFQKFEFYFRRYGDEMSQVPIDLDQDDDGKLDRSERFNFSSGIITTI